MRLRSVLRVLPALLVACGSASDVSLSVLMTDESIQVRDSAFGAALSGGFQLRLELGSEASGSTQVSLGNFSLQTDSGAPLVDVLDIQPDTAFPVQLDKGSSKQVVFTFTDGSVDRAAVCAGAVRIVGSVMDTLKGGTDPVRSGAITPDCG
ncbi:MAG: hypothetical protein WDO69_13300 [Pseudomonadota bacterium]